jgi:hypothetical protein
MITDSSQQGLGEGKIPELRRSEFKQYPYFSSELDKEYALLRHFPAQASNASLLRVCIRDASHLALMHFSKASPKPMTSRGSS